MLQFCSMNIITLVQFAELFVYYSVRDAICCSCSMQFLKLKKIKTHRKKVQNTDKKQIYVFQFHCEVLSQKKKIIRLASLTRYLIGRHDQIDTLESFNFLCLNVILSIFSSLRDIMRRKFKTECTLLVLLCYGSGTVSFLFLKVSKK